MYQTLFHDLPFMKPFGAWKVENFYKNALYRHPKQGGLLQDMYSDVWMKFGYIPHGRMKLGEDPWEQEKDVFYLMEIDSYGRRFYHKGGVCAPPIDDKWILPIDSVEGRAYRPDWGPIPEKMQKGSAKQTDYFFGQGDTYRHDEAVGRSTHNGAEDRGKTGNKEKSLDDLWMEIEAQLLGEAEPEQRGLVLDQFDKSNPAHKIIVENLTETTHLQQVKHDGVRHTYQIVGSWTGFQPEEMQASSDSVHIFDITVGENGWEEFYLIQDGDVTRRITPASERSWKSTPCVGPFNSPGEKRWLLDVRDSGDTPLEDIGSPGDKYRVTFSWAAKGVKELEWTKQEGRVGSFPKGTYQISGSWTKDYVEMTSEGEGRWTAEVKMMSATASFHVVRNKDEKQRIYPDVLVDENGHAKGSGSAGDSVQFGAWPLGKTAPVWKLSCSLGDTVSITFYRNPSIPDEIEVDWTIL